MSGFPVSDEMLPQALEITEAAGKQLKSLLGYPVIVKFEVQQDKITPAVIQHAVCEAFGLAWKDVIGKSRKGGVVDARFAYCHLCELLLKRSDKLVAADIRRHRTTVICARRTTKSWLFTNHQPFKSLVLHIKNSLLHETKA
jgi:chromosomal replication initiation ATPase DnaA